MAAASPLNAQIAVKKRLQSMFAVFGVLQQGVSRVEGDLRREQSVRCGRERDLEVDFHKTVPCGTRFETILTTADANGDHGGGVRITAPSCIDKVHVNLRVRRYVSKELSSLTSEPVQELLVLKAELWLDYV